MWNDVLEWEEFWAEDLLSVQVNTNNESAFATLEIKERQLIQRADTWGLCQYVDILCDEFRMTSLIQDLRRVFA